MMAMRASQRQSPITDMSCGANPTSRLRPGRSEATRKARRTWWRSGRYELLPSAWATAAGPSKRVKPRRAAGRGARGRLRLPVLRGRSGGVQPGRQGLSQRLRTPSPAARRGVGPVPITALAVQIGAFCLRLGPHVYCLADINRGGRTSTQSSPLSRTTRSWFSLSGTIGARIRKMT
jgi:hypothetical protein